MVTAGLAKEVDAVNHQHTTTPHFKSLEKRGGELVKEPLEINIMKRILTDAAAA
jgi:hypothetical protein